MQKIFLILSFSLFFSSTAWSYVPRAQTIIKKMARNNGRRTYTLVREVVLQSPTNQIKAKETWTIANGDKMKLRVESQNANPPWSFVINYTKNRRQTLSANKKVKSFPKSPDFFEPLFHDRSYRSLTKRLISQRFLPDWVKSTPQPDYDKGKTKMTAEPFVSLDPVEGVISYAFGAKKNTAGDNSQTTLWIEQDSFLIKKGRLRSKAEFVNSQFQSFSGGLKLPGEQTINWGSNNARIKLMTVETIKASKKTWQLNSQKSGAIPSNPLIKEFYSRFR